MAKNMTDDELLALAKRATPGEHVAMDARTLNAPATCIDFAVVAGNKETARVWTEDDARYYAAANPAAIIALIERHRAEVERLTARVAWLEAEARGDDALIKELETARKDEATRLTRERDEARAAMAGSTRGELLSALAAAQKRVAGLEPLLQRCADELQAEINARYMGLLEYPSNQRKYKLDMEAVNNTRAALKESGNGDETVRQGRRGKSES